MAFDCLILTCEHGGNRIPRQFVDRLRGAEHAVRTHRGLDIGALSVAKMLAKKQQAPLFFSTVSRLLIDLNRSLGRKGLYSEFTAFSEAERREVESKYYAPHRSAVEAWIARRVRKGQRVLHISVHSFTPVMRGIVRNADLALLYDPRRKPERSLADAWADQLKVECRDHAWRLRRNYPYHGAADGFTTYLRRVFAANSYAGIEVEMNQRVVGTADGRRRMGLVLNRTLSQL